MSSATVQSSTLVCERCGARQADTQRPFFPLWSVGPAGQSLCPDCAPSTKVTPQIARINAQAMPLASANAQQN